MSEYKRIIRFKNGVRQAILDFVKEQSNLSEVVTYLIEKEIYENGIRNLVEYIPMIRTDEYFSKMVNPIIKTEAPKKGYEVVKPLGDLGQLQEQLKSIPKGFEE